MTIAPLMATAPLTSNFPCGVAVPMPMVPALVMISLCVREESVVELRV
jgi:hypothetical protein